MTVVCLGFPYINLSLQIKMIDINKLREFVEKELADSGCFLTYLTVSPANEIVVEIDSMEPVSIDTCEALTRAIESEFDRDADDYSLEVGSAGLTTPFRVKAQYDKNIGQEVETLTLDGRKLRGLLKAAGPESFTIQVEEKVKREGEKRPVIEKREITLGYSDVKYTRYDLQF